MIGRVHAPCQPPGGSLSPCTLTRMVTVRELSGRLDIAIGSRNASEIARKLGVQPGAISNWRNGVRIPNAIRLAELCKALGESADWILGISSDRGMEPSIIYEEVAEYGAGGQQVRFPQLIGDVAAGRPRFVPIDDDERRWYYFRRPWLEHIGWHEADKNRWGVVRLDRHADSMVPTIRPGALLLLDRGPEGQGHARVDPGKIYLVWEPNEEGLTVKRAFRSRSTLILWPDNQAYEPLTIELTDRDIRSFLVGRVRWIGQEEE